jgi:hypothetical protein
MTGAGQVAVFVIAPIEDVMIAENDKWSGLMLTGKSWNKT